MIYVIATLDLQTGTRDAFLAEFKRIAAEVRAENGCLEYVPALDVDAGIATQGRSYLDRVTILEKWESVEALKAHDTSPHMQAFRARIKDWVRGRDIRSLAPA
jgi:quinol monooxygenase YgiN